MAPPIYVVTAMVLDATGRGKSTRTWGWYSTWEAAEEAILENHTDMWECDFTHAVIEEALEGIMPLCASRRWYRSIRKDGEFMSAEGTEDPMPQVVNIGMG